MSDKIINVANHSARLDKVKAMLKPAIPPKTNPSKMEGYSRIVAHKAVMGDRFYAACYFN